MPSKKSSAQRTVIHYSPDLVPFQLPSGLGATESSRRKTGFALIADVIALDTIAAKAAELGPLAGAPTGNLIAVAGGFARSYEGCDIYYSSETGAHEVHGDIRLKYLALRGPSGVLGLPTTDERGTPDGVGRYNHFVGGSIYWTPHTGPMMVRGEIRKLWADQGWETGPLGYPVQEEYRMAVNEPLAQPAPHWSLFENGAILSSEDGCAVALTAGIAPDILQRIVRKTFDDAFHKPNADGSGNNIGLQPEVETLAISTWSYGFWGSGPRRITFRLHGFHDNGLAPDTNFTLDVELGFDMFWQISFTEPLKKTLAVGLYSVSVSASGLGQKDVSDGIAGGIHDHFYPKDGPDPATPWVPSGWVAFTELKTGADLKTGYIDVLGAFLARDGSLQILLNPEPLPIGRHRKLVADKMIGKLVEDLNV